MPQIPTISQAISHYLDSLHTHYSPQTILAYAQALHLFERITQNEHHIITGRTPINKLDSMWVHTYLQQLQKTRSIETEHLYTRALLAFLQDVQLTGYFQQSNLDELTTYIITWRRSKQHNIPELPLDAIETILNHVNSISLSLNAHPPEREQLRLQRDKTFLLTLAHTGLRVSEICDLRKNNINLTQQTITLTGQSILPLPALVNTTISQYLKARYHLDNNQQLIHPDNLPLFARHDKKASKRVLPISRWTAANIVTYWVDQALSINMQSELQKHNCSISPQTFRHYFVVVLLKRTGSLDETQTLARHADTSTTRRYLRYADPDTI